MRTQQQSPQFAESINANVLNRQEHRRRGRWIPSYDMCQCLICNSTLLMLTEAHAASHQTTKAAMIADSKVKFLRK
jgi:hypothetical protein